MVRRFRSRSVMMDLPFNFERTDLMVSAINASAEPAGMCMPRAWSFRSFSSEVKQSSMLKSCD